MTSRTRHRGPAAAVLHQHHKGVRRLLPPEEAGEPGVGRLALPHLSGAGLGADVHIGKAAGAVSLGHVVGHQVRQRSRRIGRNQRAGPGGEVWQGRQTQGALGPEDQIRLRRLAAVCDGAHADHQRRRVHLVVVLPHAGPAQLTVGDVVKVKGALCRRQAADGIAAGQARLLRVLLQSARPQLLGDLGEGHVAAVGEGGGDVLLPVGAGADDGLVPHLDAAGAGPGPIRQVWDILQSRRQGHGLVHGSRRESRGQKTVQIGALVPVVGGDVLRHVQGVVAGG